MSASGSGENTSRKVARTAAWSVMCVGALVLMGWLLNIPALKRIHPDWVSMVPNTALSLLGLGMVLWRQSALTASVARHQAGRWLAILVLVLAAMSLLQNLVNRDFGIDQLLFLDDTRTSPSDKPGRMAPITAICLMLCSLALLTGRRIGMAFWLTATSLFLALVASIGYAFNVSHLYTVSGYTSMAMHTALSLTLLNLGILASRPQHALMALMLSESAGGELARRLLWLMPLMWVLLNWLVLQGAVANIYDNAFGLAAASAGGIVLTSVVIFFTAHRLRGVDEKRLEALAQLELSNRELEQKVAERTRALTTTNERLADEIAERKLAQEQVHQLSITDELTGLLNRRGFLLLAEQALKTARRVETALTLIYVDLDGLKQVNDTLGHQAGDAMIQDAADLLKSALRTSDLIARMGGDEFAILAVSGDSPAPILTKLAQSLAQFNQGADAPRRLSFSVGSVQCLPTDDRPLLDQLGLADANMYAQKRRHREAAWAASRASFSVQDESHS